MLNDVSVPVSLTGVVRRAGWMGLAAALFLLSVFCAGAQPYVPGQTYFGRSNYTVYIAGDMQMIFSAPHGGSLTPAEIPDRTNDVPGGPFYDPDFATVTDSNTEQVALAAQAVFAAMFGHSPHIIICQLQRTKLDCNRSEAEGCNGTNAAAEQAWTEFQNFIDVSSNYAILQNGRGFYIDLHGQGHAIQRLELGYLLTAQQLTNTDAKLNQSTFAVQSSIRSLAGIVSSNLGIPFSQILRGSNSFGDLMTQRGFPSIPSPTEPSPGNGTNPIVYPGDQNDYFDGGYNTAVHGSQNAAGPLDSLQIEANFDGVRDTAADRTNYVTAIAQAMDYFFTNYYGMDLRLCAPNRWKIGSGGWSTAANWAVGIVPVSGNYLMFSGAGGSVTNNLTAVSTGTGRVYSMSFDTNTTGSYLLRGNPVSLVAGITNLSTFSQTISNALTLLSNQTFAASSGPLIIATNITNTSSLLTILAGTNITVSGVVSGAGGLNKTGNGILVLSAANTYSGPTTNLAGTLLVSNTTGSATGSGALVINAGATLTGTGAVGGPATVAGTISPGNGIGTLTLTNGLNITNGVYSWALAANATNLPGANFDQMLLTGGALSLASNSTLAITFTNTATTPATNVVFWQTAHSWKVIALSGAAMNPGATKFGGVSNGSFTAGKFITSADAQGNVLLNFIPTQQPLISGSLSGAGTSNVTINWSAVAGLTYQVQFTTNLMPPVWMPLGSVQATGPNATFLDATNVQSQRFYRVIIP